MPTRERIHNVTSQNGFCSPQPNTAAVLFPFVTQCFRTCYGCSYTAYEYGNTRTTGRRLHTHN
jgi:hypothetical protein